MLTSDRSKPPVKALNEIDIRLVHLSEKLTRIGGETFDVATLPLGEDRVERQR